MSALPRPLLGKPREALEYERLSALTRSRTDPVSRLLRLLGLRRRDAGGGRR